MLRPVAVWPLGLGCSSAAEPAGIRWRDKGDPVMSVLVPRGHKDEVLGWGHEF